MKTQGRESTVERLVAYLIHDIEPALASFQSILKRLKKGRFDPENPLHQRLLNSCDLTMAYAREMMQDMVEYARLRQEKRHVAVECVNWQIFLEASVSLPLALAADAEVTLSWAIDNDVPDTYVQAGLLRRVLLNLLTNGIKNTPAGGHIQVHLFRETSNVVLEVTDDGPGLQDDQLEQIFKPRVQLDLRDSGQYHGVGLGLSFCREAIAQMEGAITVQNISPHGLCFRLKLPDLSHYQESGPKI